ncbi:MAG: YceD family protein [Steroidobacteraceae bacterium]
MELPDFPADFLTDGGQVHARLSFGREQGFAVVQVGLQASLAATCQRCLDPMTLQVDATSSVLIVESEQDAEDVPAGWETFFAPEGRLDFAALTAEELLLALPIVPLHEQTAQCRPLAPPAAATGAVAADAAAGIVAEAAAEVTTRPFADLRTLLERGAKTSK